MRRNHFLLSLTAVALLIGRSLPSTTAEESVAAASGAFFALSVADMNASARWYQERFGLKAVLQSPKADGAGVIVLEGRGLIVELIERDDAVPFRKATSGTTDPLKVHGIVKAGVIVDDFEKTLALLKKRRVEIAFGPFPAKVDQRANVIVKDNEGNLIQLFGKRLPSHQ